MTDKIEREVEHLTDIIWHKSFNVDYWKSRLERIDTDNSQEEKEEAFYLLLQLTDLYIHVLTAQLESPKDVWKYLKNDNWTNDIRDTISEYEESDSIFGYNLEKHGEEEVLANSIRLPEEIKGKANNYQKAAIGLGCPIDLEDEETSVSFIDNPEKYVEASNFFVSFWKRIYDHDGIFKDYKHGFRLPRFNERTMAYIEEIVPAIGESQEGMWEEIRERVTEEENVFFFQLKDAQEHSHILHVIEADPEKALYLSKVVMCLINNIIANDRNLEVVGDFEPIMDSEDGPNGVYDIPLHTEVFLEEEAVPGDLQDLD